MKASLKVDFDKYIADHPDVAAWIGGYKLEKGIALFEPIIRDSIAIEMHGEMEKMLCRL